MATRYGLEAEISKIAESSLKSKKKAASTKKMARFLHTLEYVMRETWGVITMIDRETTIDTMQELGYRRLKATNEFDSWQRGEEDIINMPVQRGGSMDLSTNQKVAAWSAVAKAEFRRVEYLLTEVLLRNSKHKAFVGKPITRATAITK